MTREEIYLLLEECILSVIPDVQRERIAPELSFRQLGADSIDRSDIATVLKTRLGVDITPVEIGKARDLGAVVELLHGRI